MVYRVELTERNSPNVYETLVTATSHEAAYRQACERYNGGKTLPDARIVEVDQPLTR